MHFQDMEYRRPPLDATVRQKAMHKQGKFF